MVIHAFPERVISVQAPGDRLGIGKRCFLAVVIFDRLFEVDEIVVMRFLEAFTRAFYRALVAAELAYDRARNVDAAQLLDCMIEYAVTENVVPRIREKPEACGTCARTALLSGRG